MKKIIFLFIFGLILSGVCFALTPEDNGYAWKKASQDDKIAVCKGLPSTIGQSETYWVEVLDGFYETDNWNIQSLKIKEITAQMPLSEQLPEQEEKQ